MIIYMKDEILVVFDRIGGFADLAEAEYLAFLKA